MFHMASSPMLWNKARRPNNAREIKNDRPITIVRWNLTYGSDISGLRLGSLYIFIWRYVL